MKLQSKPLITPTFDFLLCGGLSIVVWLFFIFFEATQNQLKSSQMYLLQVPATFAFLSIAVNFPHFISSYHLAYRQKFSFIFKNWFQFIFIPIALLFIFIYSGHYFFTTTPNTFLKQFPLLGTNTLHIMINLMFALVGWHYTKQSFGCTMVLAKSYQYPINSKQKFLLKYCLISLWLLNYSWAHQAGAKKSFFETPYYSLNLPNQLYPLSMSLFLILLIFSFYYVFYRNRRQSSLINQAIIFSPFFSIFFWWHPWLYSVTFYTYLSAFFHSLQYLVFSSKVVYEQNEKKKLNFSLYLIYFIILGLAVFQFLPETLDHHFKSQEITKISFWMISFHLFINIHHYFIDNVLWRFDNKEVINPLFR